MFEWIFFKGMIVGLLIAAPVGPINVLVIRRTLVHGRLAGIASGLGAALADTIFGAIAALGVSMLQNFLEQERALLSLVGAAVLVGMGLRLLRRPAPTLSAGSDPTSLFADFTSTLFLTLTNPITVLSFMAVFAAFGVRPDGQIGEDDILLLAGVASGATAWWLIVVEGVCLFRDRFTTTGLTWANRIAAIVILGFAVAVAGEAALRKLGLL
ncbi:MAG: LysE family translocator [Alphaproteobacteria bacterium]|nr:LysE family translocator [Alphaproteobacteria bacterium]